ncbi:MAG: SCO family protein [Brumimicrobium sp.]|nr:SCO family protein [Brumimicrobium sp.]
MTKFNYISIIFLCFFFLESCSNQENTAIHEENLKTEKEAFSGELPELSVYHLPSTWTNQNNETIKLEDLRGDIIVTVMIYTSCKASCPRLVADVRRIYEKVSDHTNEQTKYVFVSIDPETDTPERMKAFAKENEMDTDQWMFLRGNMDDTREFANVLAVGYKRISPLDFSHSNIISVFDQNGVLQYQKEGLDQNIDQVVEEIEKLSLQ